MSDLKKRITNLLTKLRVEENSVLFAKGDLLNKKTVKKISKSRYAKDKVLYNLYSSFVKSRGKASEFSSKKVVLTQRGDMLHTIDEPMQLIHADIADLHFFSKLAVAPKYCLVCVDLFTLKMYTYGVKKKSQLSAKLEKLYSDTESLREYLKRKNRHQTQLQTNQEFNKKEIAEINKKNNVLHYNSKFNDGHVVGAE